MQKIKIIVISFFIGAIVGNTNKIKDEIKKFYSTKELRASGLDQKAEANFFDVSVKTVKKFEGHFRTAGLLVLGNDSEPTIFYQDGAIDSLSLKATKLSPSDFFYEGTGGIKSVFTVNKKLYFLYSAFDGKNCYQLKIADIAKQQVVLEAGCLPDPTQIDFNGSGGGWVTNGAQTYLSTGAPEGFSSIIRQLAQDSKSYYGKVISLKASRNGDSLDWKLFAKGFRNPQGLARSIHGLISVEHGPRGGDEVNLVKENKNYGWPLVSYGATYRGQTDSGGESLIFPEDHFSLGFEEPLYSFVPSIGLGNVAACPKFINDGNCVLLLSLKDTTLYAARFGKTAIGPKIVSIEPLVETPHRLRHFALREDGSLYVKDNSIFIAADRHGILKISFDRFQAPMGKVMSKEFIVTSRPMSSGEKIYQRDCATCHNPDPRLQGNIGPAIWGSSKDLLTSKMLEGEYPIFYSPKRTTNVMPKFPKSDSDIEEIYKFLNQ